jgi:hypothetical protein
MPMDDMPKPKTKVRLNLARFTINEFNQRSSPLNFPLFHQ